MHTYETLFITPPTLTEAEEQETVDGLAQIVGQGGGSLVVNERMGRRRLAYPIEKHSDGVYVRLLYDSEPDVPKELERRARISDRVLRSLTVRLEPDQAVAAKEQAVRDAQARVEAAAREKDLAEQESEARKASAMAGVPGPDDPDSDADADEDEFDES